MKSKCSHIESLENKAMWQQYSKDFKIGKLFPSMFPGMAEMLEYAHKAGKKVLWRWSHSLKVSDISFYRLSPVICQVLHVMSTCSFCMNHFWERNISHFTETQHISAELVWKCQLELP
jgi:hypothetical protein